MSVEELKSQIEQDVQRDAVHVYMKGTPQWPQCGFSKAACDVFRVLNVPFGSTNVLENLEGYRAALSSITSWPTIPQIFIDGEFVGGCDILVEMYHKGELQKMLADKMQGQPQEPAQQQAD